MNTKKYLATAAIGAGLVAGSFGVASATSMASAQTLTTSSTATSAHPVMRHLRHAEFKVAANTIGIPTAQLRSDLTGGESVADVATGKGVPVENVVNAVVQDASAKLDHAVTTGKITQTQDNQLKAKLPTFAAGLVNAHRATTTPG